MSAISFDTFELSKFDTLKLNLSAKLTAFNQSFKTSVSPENGYFQKADAYVDNNLSRWLNIESAVKIAPVRPSCFAVVKEMYRGIQSDVGKTLGLLDISKMKINPEFREQNISQQSGFAAEVIGTAKENIKAAIEGSGLTTVRADERPDLFPKNDQYVDKVRMNASGEIVERIQTKFVGKNAAENFSKLTSSKYDKYFNDGKVDKIEIPSDFYDDIKNKLIPEKLSKLERQLERVKADGKIDVAQKLEKQIERCNKIDSMIEKSTVSKDEARYARLHPERYAAKLFAKEIISVGHKAGMQSGLAATGLTAAISTVNNVRMVMNGEISAQKAFMDVAVGTGTAGAIGYGVGFVSSAVAETMLTSSHKLIQSLGKANVPAAVIAFGIDSYDSVIDYAQSKIGGAELVHDLGESAVGVAGSIAGSALSGAAVGSVVPGAGTVIGFGAGLVGGMVGYAVSTGAYATAIEIATEGVQVVGDAARNAASGIADTYTAVSDTVVESADVLMDKAVEMGQSVIDSVASAAPEALDDVKSAMNDFAASLGVPIHL